VITMPELDFVQERINKARQRYLEALNSYRPDGKKDAETIVNEFLSKLLEPDPDRSNIARQEAQETIALIKQFRAVEIRFTYHIALLGLQLDLTVTSLETIVFRRYMDAVIGGPAAAGSDAPPLEQVLQFGRRLQRAIQAQGPAAQEAMAQAAVVGNQYAYLANSASMLLFMRKATLRSFAGEHLDEKSWLGLLADFDKELNEITADIALDKSIEFIAERAADVFGIALAGVPVGTLAKGSAKILTKVIRKREIDLRPGATDQMQLLLEQLRAENAMFEEFDKQYSKTMALFDELAHVGRPTTGGLPSNDAMSPPGR
jgi:hypothetical protein